MTKGASKVTIHMVSSLDGFIAKKDGSTSWMMSTDNYEQGVALTDEYIAEFLKSIDCYVMGSQTYEHAMKLGWPYGDVPVFVLTQRELAKNRDSVEFCPGDLETLINNRLKPNYNNIWMVGGSALTKDFIQKKLADQIVMSILPIILGEGILFFDYIGQEQPLHLQDVTAFKDGMVELTYEIVKR